MDEAELDIFRRGLRRATEASSGAALDAVLIDFGWRQALAADPCPAVSILFESQGRAHATSSALHDVLLEALHLDAPPGTAVVIPAADRWHPPGVLDGTRLSVRGLGLSPPAGTDQILVVSRAVDGDTAAVVRRADLTVRPLAGMDPWLALVEVTGTASITGAVRPLPPGRWDAAVRLARLAIGHELVGAADAMLELARTHSLGRIQFGRPISTFQAVRHRLADTLVAIETARALLADAWEDGAPETAAMAKAMAGRGARTASRHCQQVLAGIGFTTEHPFHRFARRVFVLDALFGSARSLTTALGGDLIATRTLPTPLPL